MKIMTVVGARPNFMKSPPIIAAIREHNNQARRANAGLSSESPVPMIDHTLVHTGQHYDPAMSDAFFADLQLPPPDIRLGIGSASHGVQTAEILRPLDAGGSQPRGNGSRGRPALCDGTERGDEPA